MLTIRLQRIGKRKQPYYRLIISEKGRDTQAGSLEILGHYGPTQTPKILELNVDRIKHWLNVGAQTSNTIHNLLVKEGIISGEKKKKSVKISNKRKTKIEKKKVEEEAKKAAAKQKELEAKQKAEEEAKAAEEAKKAETMTVETPVEETKVEEKPAE